MGLVLKAGIVLLIFSFFLTQPFSYFSYAQTVDSQSLIYDPNPSVDEESFTSFKNLAKCMLFLPFCFSGAGNLDNGELPPIEPPISVPLAPTGLVDWQQEIREKCLELYNLVKQYCENSSLNKQCWEDKIKSSPLFQNSPQAAQEIEKSFDIDADHVLQCVGLVKACNALANTPWDKSYGPAKNYPRNEWPTGFRFIDKNSAEAQQEGIKVGDVPVWNGLLVRRKDGTSYITAGHMAIVINVNSSNDFDVVEANLATIPDGNVKVRPKHINPFNGPDSWATALMGWYRKI